MDIRESQSRHPFSLQFLERQEREQDIVDDVTAGQLLLLDPAFPLS